MRRMKLSGQEIIMTSNRRVDETGFAKACEYIRHIHDEILKMEKSSIIIVHDQKHNSIVVERMNTDTFTIQVQYEINGQNVFQITNKK